MILVVFTSVVAVLNDTRHYINENQWRYADETEIIWNPQKKIPSNLLKPGITSLFQSVKKAQLRKFGSIRPLSRTPSWHSLVWDWVWDSQSGNYEEYGLLVCNLVWFGESLMFRGIYCQTSWNQQKLVASFVLLSSVLIYWKHEKLKISWLHVSCHNHSHYARKQVLI